MPSLLKAARSQSVIVFVTMLARAVLVLLLLYNTFFKVNGECPPERQEASHHEAKLHNDLTCAYDTSYRPVKDHKSTITVKVRFAIKYISFDALEETFNVHSWVAMQWKDEFLTWDPSKYGNIKDIQMESHNIWTPKMSLFNANVELYEYEDIYSTCLVNNNGTVFCVPRVPHSGICKTSLKYWPYDVQNCTMYFGSWMHTGEQVNFTFYDSRSVILDDYQDGPGWKLENVVHERLPGNYSCCPNVTYPMLKYTFELKRESAGPAAIVVVPSVVIVIMTLISFLLDVNDNSRLALQCFALFGHFIFLTEIGYDIPKHSADTPIILLFIRDSMLVTLWSILLTLILTSLRRRSEPAPSWAGAIHRLVTTGPAKYVVFTEFNASDDKKTLTENNPTDARSTSEWLMLANLLNCVFFIINFVVYVILLFVYIPKEKDIPSNLPDLEK